MFWSSAKEVIHPFGKFVNQSRAGKNRVDPNSLLILLNVLAGVSGPIILLNILCTERLEDINVIIMICIRRVSVAIRLSLSYCTGHPWDFVYHFLQEGKLLLYGFIHATKDMLKKVHPSRQIRVRLDMGG